MSDILKIGDLEIGLGEIASTELSISRLYDTTEMKIPVKVYRGKKPGPTLFISAVIHGNEINGLEIIRRILAKKELKKINGTLIAVPIVNVFGFNNKSRYLPDRRDLNRSFPGSEKGSLAARIAHIFMKEIVLKSTHGIDLHTGAIHRTNLPQIRACISDPETKKLAEAFKAPVILDSSVKDGSLRESARENNIPILLYEGGEALRFDEWAIKPAVFGIMRIMREIGMLPPKAQNSNPSQIHTYTALGSQWARADSGGTFRIRKKLGERVQIGDVLGYIQDPLGEKKTAVLSKSTGIIVGMSKIPLVNQGDALMHVATFENSGDVEGFIDDLDEYFN